MKRGYILYLQLLVSVMEVVKMVEDVCREDVVDVNMVSKEKDVTYPPNCTIQ